MFSASTALRGIAKAVGWLLFGLFTLLVVWFVANRLSDPAPSSAQIELSKAVGSQVEDGKNAAVAILGLTAPKGTDFIQHGIQIKALYAGNAPNAQIQEMVRGSQTLRPTVEGNQVTCWLDPGWTPFKDCLPFEKAPAVLAENTELLQRYKALYGLSDYAASDIYYNDAYLILVRLAIAEMQVNLRPAQLRISIPKVARTAFWPR